MPTTIKQGSTVKATYTYLADGTKIKAVNAYNGGSDYVGSFKYNRNGSNITLESVATAGGRTYKTSGGYEARYFVTDHLGSTRLIAYPNGNVIEQNDYMPYGERHANSSLATSGNPYLYNGKESQKSFGVNYIDSEARFQRLDGAFNSIDPLCEKYYHISPYTYCAANPINLIDENGRDWRIHKDKDKKGNPRYNFMVTGVLYNDSSYDIDLSALQKSITEVINSAYTIDEESFSTTMCLELRIADSVEDIDETDHVFRIVDQIVSDVPNVETLGNATIGGLQIRLTARTAEKVINGIDMRTPGHELGHTGGLLHTSIKMVDSHYNLMTQSIDTKSSNKATKLTKHQIEQIYFNFNHGKLNGFSPVIYTHRTNSFPYFGLKRHKILKP